MTGGQGCVSFWDLNYGDLLQTVYLGKNSEAQPARQILVLDNAAIVCNFGSELSLVYVPSVLEKLDRGWASLPICLGALWGSALVWGEDLACLWEAACELSCPAS